MDACPQTPASARIALQFLPRNIQLAFRTWSKYDTQLVDMYLDGRENTGDNAEHP